MTEPWRIVPFRELGPLRLGDDRRHVREVVASLFPGAEPDAREERDAYDALGLHLDYDPTDTLKFIEVFPPVMVALGETVFRFGDPEFAASLADRLQADIHEVNETWDVPSLSLALYVPDESLEAVAIYRAGYYDDLAAEG